MTEAEPKPIRPLWPTPITLTPITLRPLWATPAQADEPAAALLGLDELLEDDDEDAAAELPFDDDPELPLLDDPLSDPPLPDVDVALDADEVSLVDDDSLAGDGVAEPLDLSARESVR